MKKFIVLLLLLLVVCSCDETNTIIGLSKGDKRVTITEHYIYVEKCTGINGFDVPFWKYERIISKDSINQEIDLRHIIYENKEERKDNRSSTH